MAQVNHNVCTQHVQENISVSTRTSGNIYSTKQQIYVKEETLYVKIKLHIANIMQSKD